MPTQIVKQNVPMTNPYITNNSNMDNTVNLTRNNLSGNNTNTFGDNNNPSVYQNSNMGIPTQLVKQNHPMTIPYVTTIPPIVEEDLNRQPTKNSLFNNNGKDVNSRSNSVFNQNQNQIKNKKLMDIIDPNDILR
jgi:hypothetical protein